jgi:IS30 family transposase
MKYEHITDAERRSIERAKQSGKSMRWIARRLERSPSSISDEIKNNSVKGEYVARKAIHKSKQRRRDSKIQCMKVAMDTDLKQFVTDSIVDDQSPVGISARLKHKEKDRPYASPKAIYKFVHSVHGRKIEKHLYSKRIKKKSGPKRHHSNSVNSTKIMIDKRPKSVDRRLEFGHLEGDFIESGSGGTGSLLVLVERKTRYPFLLYTKDRTTAHINNCIHTLLKDVPIKSLTLDGDVSFQKHEELSELLESVVYFCHPYTSQEKGTVENRNKAIRQHVPKKTDLSTISKKEFERILKWLRSRFMVCLKGSTPQEAWDEEIKKYQTSLLKTKKSTKSRGVYKKKGVRVQG